MLFFCIDLRQELAVKEKERKKPGDGLEFSKDKESNKENKEPLKIEGSPLKPETTSQTSDFHATTASIGTSPLHTGYGTSPLTPSARISALNIVGDLLRKVGVSDLHIFFFSEKERIAVLMQFDVALLVGTFFLSFLSYLTHVTLLSLLQLRPLNLNWLHVETLLKINLEIQEDQLGLTAPQILQGNESSH